MNALIAEARKKYHKELLSSGVMTIDSKGIPSNADSSSKLSINIARGIADQLMAEVHEKAVGQTSGAKFCLLYTSLPVCGNVKMPLSSFSLKEMPI